MHSRDAAPFEEFNRKKIEMALVRAGVRGDDVEKIAAAVKPFEEMTTDDINEVVVKELESTDPASAMCWKIVRDYRRSRNYTKNVLKK